MRKGNAAEQEWTARVMSACQFLKAHDYADVAAFLAKQELSARKPTRRANWINAVDLSAGERAEDEP